jgi:hypothetical protein
MVKSLGLGVEAFDDIAGHRAKSFERRPCKSIAGTLQNAARATRPESEISSAPVFHDESNRGLSMKNKMMKKQKNVTRTPVLPSH